MPVAGRITTPDMTEAEKQLRHANEQLAIAGAYPDRERAQHAARPLRREREGASIKRIPKYRSVAPTHNGI